MRHSSLGRLLAFALLWSFSFGGCASHCRPCGGRVQSSTGCAANDRIRASLASRRPETSLGEIEVVVVDSNGHGVSGAQVDATTIGYPYYLMPPQEAPHQAVTDTHGRTRFLRLRPGTYDLAARAKGFALEITRGIRLEGNRLEHVRVVLRPALPEYSVLVIFRVDNVRSDGERARIASLLGAHGIGTVRTPTNLSIYSLLVRRDKLAEAQNILIQDPTLRARPETTFTFLGACDGHAA
jgi:hypothetical protein